MPLGTVGLAIASGLGSAVVGAIGANKAAKAQEQAANNSLSLQREIYDKSQTDFAPWREAGGTALDAYNYELGLGERPASYGGMQASPAFDFLMNQGVDTIQSGAAARGGLYSGATGTALERYRMGLASQESNNFLNRLAGQSGAGQAAAGMQANSGQFFAQGAGQAYSDIGNARSAGAIGVGNAISGGFEQGLGTYGYLQNLRTGG